MPERLEQSPARGEGDFRHRSVIRSSQKLCQIRSLRETVFSERVVGRVLVRVSPLAGAVRNALDGDFFADDKSSARPENSPQFFCRNRFAGCNDNTRQIVSEAKSAAFELTHVDSRPEQPFLVELLLQLADVFQVEVLNHDHQLSRRRKIGNRLTRFLLNQQANAPVEFHQFFQRVLRKTSQRAQRHGEDGQETQHVFLQCQFPFWANKSSCVTHHVPS